MPRKPANPTIALATIAAIGGAMAYAEAMLSFGARSTALAANALIFLQHSFAAAFALWAVLGTIRRRPWFAPALGVVTILLGFGVIAVGVTRLVRDAMPDGEWILLFALLALGVSVMIGILAVSYREAAPPVERLWAFSRNDVVGALIAMLAGLLVEITGSNAPDIAIGIVGAGTAIAGGVKMVRSGRTAYDG